MNHKLFLDISSTCTGYVIAEVTDVCKIKETGVVWFQKDAYISDKCRAIYRFVINKDYDYSFDQVIYEQYVFNTKRVMGAVVSPQIQGAVLTAVGKLEIPSEDITPQTWRKNCGIKAVKVGKKRDWKQPTKDYFNSKFNISDKIESNITGNMRTTPSDLYDALGVCEGFCKSNGIEEIIYE